MADVLLAQTAQQGNSIPEDQQEAVTALFNSPVLAFVIRALPAVFVPLMFLLVAGIYFCLFLIFGSTARYIQYLSLLTFAYTPQILSSCVLIVLVFVSRPTSLDPSMLGGVSPAIFITLEPGSVTPTPLFAAASSLNLFTIWVLVLLVMAFKNLVSKRASILSVIVIVIIPWLFWVGYRVGMAALFG